ncbi:ly6/PLAUR domain-containing protein 3-like [Megalobrama amblycephala]|uniref:ly6/PLAUR domain-containing protein 3-like n=1 Tax=Megalobrama amblycephala TaxID=75352 RepID=UPI002013E0B5|nr:ly6/PLAUR domain-containing protein 3-like [Megalobrama amblycephala]
MDLQISVFLLFILFTAGTKTNSFYNVPDFKYRSYFSTKCYECMHDPTGSCMKISVQCPVGFYKCFSSTMVIEHGFLGLDTEVMNKTCAVGCKSGSLNSGKLKISGSCCGTNFCNAIDAPDPRKNIPNGNKCYYCDDQSCSNILSCSGTEDRCVTLRMTLGGALMVLKGCVSKSLCDTPTSTLIQEFSCCEGNLCNGDKRVSQSVTQSSMYNRDKRVTKSFIQSFVHKSDTQSSIYNGAHSVTQSFLFLCSSLLSYFLLH